jgi:hypothetical protein
MKPVLFADERLWKRSWRPAIWRISQSRYIAATEALAARRSMNF